MPISQDILSAIEYLKNLKQQWKKLARLIISKTPDIEIAQDFFKES